MSDAAVNDQNERDGQHRYVDSQPTWLSAQSLAATFSSATIDCRGYHQLEFTITIDSTDDPVGDLYLEGAAVDVAARMLPVQLELGKVLSSNAAVTHTGADLTKIVINDPAATATVSFKVELPFAFMRLRYVRGSGGSATGMTAAYVLH